MLLDDCHVSYINLAHRLDRRSHMEMELARVGIVAERYEAISTKGPGWNRHPYEVMFRRTPGAVGCFLSQLGVMQDAGEKEKHAMVLEDDLVFGSDTKERLEYINTFLKTQESWDIVFLGGTVHVPAYWHTGMNRDLWDCRCEIKRDAVCTDDPRILQVFGAFSTHAYIVRRESLAKVVYMLNSVMHEAMGIDWALIKLQPQLKCFMMVPGIAKQIDNQSDIGYGITRFSGFAKLNGSIENSKYWWQDRMEDFDPTTFDWKEAKK